jgi:hypothetical protein
MATEMFDPAQIDAAVGDALGVKIKPTARPAPAAPTMAQPKTPAPIRTNNPGALMPGGKLAEFGSMEEGLAALDKNLKGYKRKGINTLEGVISTWAPPNENDTKAYIAHVARVTGLDPKQSIDLDSPLVRQQLTAGIVQMESGRKAVFGHTGKADATPGQLSVDDLMKPDAVNAAVADAFNEPPPKGKVASKVTSFLRGSAALADTVAGVVPGVAGMATYAGARAMGQTPEQAEATKGKVVSAIDKPFGKAFGVTETPEYKGEVTQQLMQYIGENVDKGADFISKQTGMSKPEVQYYMELGLTALPFSKTVQREVGMAGQAAKQAGGKVLQATKDVTPAFVQRGVGATVEAIAPGMTRAPRRAPTLGVPGQPTAPGVPVPPQAVPPAPGRASAGAAATPDATIVRQALTSATPEFQQLYGNMPLDKVNTPVVLRHLEADSLPIPVRLTEGEATGNPILISEEMNLRGKNPELAMRKNEANQQLVDNVPLIRERAAPDVYTTKTIESSQALIDEYKALDKTRNAAIDTKFTELRDKAGGELPVDSPALLKNIDQQLSKELLLTDGQGISQYRELKTLADSGAMTFDQYLSMRRNLSRMSAEAKDGNVRQAARIMVQELDKLPLSNETAALKPIADQARGLARERFEALKKDPAYKAAVNDSVPADKYFNKFVINGVNKNINTMIDTLGRDSLGHQHIKAGTINYLSDKAGIIDGKGNFSQANYNKNLKRLDDVNNLGAIFDPESQLQLRTLGNVAAYTQFQPRGSFVNNSNSVVAYLANKAAGGLEQVGNVAGFKFAGGIPIGTMARQAVQRSKEKTRVEKALKPGAGSTLDEISQKGQRPRIDPTME